MLRHLLSIVVALGAGLVALPLAWSSGGTMSRISAQFGPGAEDVAGPAILLVVACLLLLAVGGSIWLSGLGAVIAGGLHLLAGVLLVLWPFDPIRGVQSPVLSMIFTFFGPSSELGIGAILFVATGTGLLAGAILVGAGLGSLRRSPGARPGAVLAALLGSIVLLAVIGVASVLGGTLYREAFVYLRPNFMTGVLLLVLALLAGAAALTARWSAAPLLISGGLTTVGGIVLLAAPEVPYSAEFLRDLAYTGTAGTLLTLGVLVLGTGLGVVLGARRRADVGADPVGGSQPPPPTGEPIQAV